MEHGFLISWLPVFVFFILSFCSVFGFVFLSGLFTDNSAGVSKTKHTGYFQYITNDKDLRYISLPLVILILFCSIIYLFPWALVVSGGTLGRRALPAGLFFSALLALGYLYTRRRPSDPDRSGNSVE